LPRGATNHPFIYVYYLGLEGVREAREVPEGAIGHAQAGLDLGYD